MIFIAAIVAVMLVTPAMVKGAQCQTNADCQAAPNMKCWLQDQPAGSKNYCYTDCTLTKQVGYSDSCNVDSDCIDLTLMASSVGVNFGCLEKTCCVKKPVVSVSLDKTEFDPQKGESVKITINYNQGSFKSSIKVLSESGQPVKDFAPFNTPTSYPYTWNKWDSTVTSWDGKNNDGTKISYGNYIIHVYAYLSDDTFAQDFKLDTPLVAKALQTPTTQQLQDCVYTPAKPEAKCVQDPNIYTFSSWYIMLCQNDNKWHTTTFTQLTEQNCRQKCKDTYPACSTLPATTTTTTTTSTTKNAQTCADQCKTAYSAYGATGGECRDRAGLVYQETEMPLRANSPDCISGGKLCVCQLPQSACRKACENMNAISGDCIQTSSSSSSVALTSCTSCISQGQGYCSSQQYQINQRSTGCVYSSNTADVQACQATYGTVYTTQAQCNQQFGGGYVPYYTVPAQDSSLIFPAGSDKCPDSQSQTCYCVRTPLGSDKAFAVAIDKSCVRGQNYNIVNALIAWGGTEAKYATVSFQGSYAQTVGTGSLQYTVSSQLPSVYSSGFSAVGGSCNGMGSSPFAVGSYSVPSGQEFMYAMQHLIPCTTKVYGSGDMVTGVVTLYNAKKIPIANVPITFTCENVQQIGLPEPVEIPRPAAGYPSAKMLKIKCNDDIDHEWNLVDFDTGTGLTTSSFGFCEISFEQYQLFNSIEMVVSSNITINRIIIDTTSIDVNKDTRPDSYFRYDFASTKGRLLRIEYGSYTSGEACTEDYLPVCGDDGKTYDNECKALKEGASVQCRQLCPCPSSTERKNLCKYDTDSLTRFYCYRSNKCDDPYRTATLEKTIDTESECIAICLQLQKENSTLMGCDEIAPSSATGQITGKASIFDSFQGGETSAAKKNKITFKEINPFPESLIITSDISPQLTIENNPVAITGYVMKKTSTDIGQRLTCMGNWITGPYPEGCDASVDWGWLVNKHVDASCKPGPAPDYIQAETSCRSPSGAIVTLQFIQAVAETYNIYECVKDPTRPGCPTKPTTSGGGGGTGTPPSTCGNGVCDLLETKNNCPVDCGGTGAYCGNGVCDPLETPDNCPRDCGTVCSGYTVCFPLKCDTKTKKCVCKTDSDCTADLLKHTCNIATGACVASLTGGVTVEGQTVPIAGEKVTFAATKSGAEITGRVIDPATAAAIATLINTLITLFQAEEAAKLQARLGACRYYRDFRTQCFAGGGEAVCPKGDPKYPNLLSTAYSSVDLTNPRTNVIINIPVDYDACTYFAPTRPAERAGGASVKITLFKGHITPPGSASGVVWVKDIKTDSNGTFSYQVTAPEPGNYTIFMEAFGSYGSTYTYFDVVEPEDPLIDATPVSQCGTGDILYTLTVNSPTESEGVGSLISYDLSFEGSSDFTAGFVLPSGELSDTYVMPIPLGESSTVVFAAEPKRVLAESNYEFKIKADSDEHGLHGETSIDYFYTKRRPPTVTFTPPKIVVESGRIGRFYVNVTNNDPQQCDQALFYFSREVPSGWTSKFSVDGDEVQNMLIDSQSTVQGFFEVQSSVSAKKENNVSIVISREASRDFVKVTGIKSVASDNAMIYFTTSNAIKSVLKSGGTPATILANVSPVGIAVDPADAGLIYWAEHGIKAVDKNGVGEKTIADGYATQIAIDSSYIYFADRNTIKKVAKTDSMKDCSGDNCLLVGNASSVTDIAVDEGNNFIYWVEDGSVIKRASRDGTNIATLRSDSNIQGIAAGSVFYSIKTPGKIMRCDVFMSSCETVTAGLIEPGDLIVDSSDVYWIEKTGIRTIGSDATTVYGSAIYEVKPPPYPDVIIQPAVQTGPGGKEKTFRVNITNYASGSIVLNFTVECPAGWMCELPAYTTVPKGNKILNMVVTPVASASIGEYRIYINATGDYWKETFRRYAAHRIGLHVKPIVDIVPTSQSGYPKQVLTYSVVVNNKDDSTYEESYFMIAIAEKPFGWDATLGDDYLTIAGESKRNTTLSVTSNRSSFDGHYKIRVAASLENLTGFGDTDYEVKICGNGVCDTERGEKPQTCPQDCWEPGYSQFNCTYKNGLGLYECDNTTESGVVFSADVKFAGSSPALIVCSRFSTLGDCKSAYDSNECGPAGSCLCGSSSKKCSIACGDDVGEYYLLYKVSQFEGLSYKDLMINSPNYTYECPYFGLDELRAIRANLTEKKALLEQASDDALELHDDKQCSDALALAARKIGELIDFIDSVLANPTLDGAKEARERYITLQSETDRIISRGCLAQQCAGNVQCSQDADCNDNNDKTIDICSNICECRHTTQCPYNCSATCENTIGQACYRAYDYGKIGCSNNQFCCEKVEVACPETSIPSGCSSGKVKCADGSCRFDCGPGPSVPPNTPPCPDETQTRCADNTCKDDCGPGPISPMDCDATITANCQPIGNYTYDVSMSVVWSGGDHAKAYVFGQESDPQESDVFTYNQTTSSPGRVETRVKVYSADETVKCERNSSALCMASIAACANGTVYNADTGICECPEGTTYDEFIGGCIEVGTGEMSWVSYVTIIIAIPVLAIVAFYFRDDIKRQFNRFKIWWHYKFS